MQFQGWKNKKLTIHNFDRIMDEKTVERGFNYWLSQAIADLEELEGGLWQATVWGSMPLVISIQISDEYLVGWKAEPGYEWSIISRHVVAVLFAIRNQLEDTELPSLTRRQELMEMLDRTPNEEIKKFIEDYALKSKEFFLSFLAKFSSGEEVNRLKHYYARFIIENARLYRRDDNFIDSEEMPRFIKPIEKLLQKAEVYTKEKQYPLSVPICQAIIEELVRLLPQCEISRRLEDAIENAFKLLLRAAEGTDRDSFLRGRLAQYAEEQLETGMYQKYDLEHKFRALKVRLSL